MQVSSRDVRSIIGTRITEAGLASLVDLQGQRVIDLPSGFFMELPIRDASRSADVEDVIRNMQDELRKENVQLQVLIRPIWTVEQISGSDLAISDLGTPRASFTFEVNLSSGRERATVSIDVASTALDVVREKLGIAELVGSLGWTPAKGDVSERCLKVVVVSYVQDELKGKGAAFWDPRSEMVREFDRAAALALLGESTSFRDLRVAIQDAFKGSLSTTFLSGLASQEIDIRNFEQVLPELSNLLGGAFAPGDRFLTSAVDLYTRLRPAEQELLRCYFDEQASDFEGSNI